MIKKHSSHIKYLVLIIAFMVSVIATSVVMYLDLANASGDSIARLNLSRRVVDGTSPGFSQLGYVWLPAPSLLMLPMIWSDAFYYSGFAGILLSMIAFVLAGWFLFRIGDIVAGPVAGGFAALIFMLNPNTLYMQSTPLSEMFYIAAMLGALMYALLWARYSKEMYLVASGAAFLFATLSRYDGWIFAIATVCLVSLYLYLTSRDFRKMEATVILFATFAFLGPLLWLSWNYAIFDNPFYFAIGEYSSKGQQESLAAAGFLPSKGDLPSALAHVWYATQMVSGWALLICSVFGLLFVLRQIFVKKQLRYLFVILLGVHIAYYILNVFSGNAVIFVPQLAPYLLFNVRYALMFLPLFALLVGVLGARFHRLGILMLVIILAEYGVMLINDNVVTLHEAIEGFAGAQVNESRLQGGKWLRGNYDKGLILVDVFNNDAVPFASHVPFKYWVHTGDPALFGAALKAPERVVDWVVLREKDSIDERFRGGEWLADNFDCVYSYQDIEIYHIRTDERSRIVASDCKVGTQRAGAESGREAL
ncbi:MAG: hypothetical protein EXS68_00790 [Candidatus Ryanbacteria bacterium]|nr:hypothetical protein [Candidatus Ryanbacteria bacterium]